jgi:hypothetical protein
MNQNPIGPQRTENQAPQLVAEASSLLRIATLRSAKQLLLIIVGVCVLEFGCRDSAVIWSAESRSPDGHYLASASTEQFGGPGTAAVETTVYLKEGSQSPVEILELSNEGAYPAGITSVGMNWLTPSHLELTYKGHATVDFEAVKCAGIDISVRDVSGPTTKTPR